jgi:hypothetical protein
MSPLWHDAVDRTRTFYTLQNARQEHCKHQSDSGLPDIAQEDTALCLLQISALNNIRDCGLAVARIDKCDTGHGASY